MQLSAAPRTVLVHLTLCLSLLVIRDFVQGSDVHIVEGKRACDRGGGAYCSRGFVKGYIGPLDTAAQIKEALEATSYKKEVIIFGESRASDASQTLARFRSVTAYCSHCT